MSHIFLMNENIADLIMRKFIPQEESNFNHESTEIELNMVKWYNIVLLEGI